MDVVKSAARIRWLEAEVQRLEHALTSVKLLATLVAVPSILHGVDLTERDYDVLTRLIEGDTNEQIADHLTIGVGTVKFHVNKLARKFGTHNRHGTVAAALRTPTQIAPKRIGSNHGTVHA